MKPYYLLICIFSYIVESFGQNFGSFASAVFIEANGNTLFYNCDGHGTANGIGNVPFSGSLGSFSENSGSLYLRGAEIKTWKNNGANVCTPRIYYRVFPIGNPSGSFSNFNINFYCGCTGGEFACGGGPCGGNDQKWQTPGNGSSMNIDLTAFTPGTYELEVYYEVPGSDVNTFDCGILRYDSNGGTNYKMSFTIQAAPMPVTFLSFYGLVSSKVVEMYWSTATEKNNDYFIIEKSLDGKLFNSIGQVSGSGDSNDKRSYSFFYPVILVEPTYFRLRQVDFDGRYSFSQTIRLNPDTGVFDPLKVFPNPASTFVNVETITEGTLEVVNIQGKQAETYKLSEGMNSLNISEWRRTGNQFLLRFTDSNGKVVNTTLFLIE